MRMLLVIATVATTALVSQVNADEVSSEGQISSATLAEFGLGEMSLVSDADGEQIRGTYRYGYKPKVNHRKRTRTKVIVKKKLSEVKYKIDKALYTAVKKSKYNPHVIKSARKASYAINRAFYKVYRSLH